VAGFQVSASGGSACYPYSDSFGLQVNGTWDNGLIGDGSGGTTLTVDLGGLYSWVGGFVDYEIKFEGNPPDALPPVMAAIAADGVTVLESYDLSVFAPILTPGGYNEGAFRGIDYGSAEIRYLEFGGSHTLMHSITLGGSNVAEPATILLAGSALAAFGLGLLRRRRG